MFLRTGDEQKPVSEDVRYFRKNNVQVGVSPQIISMLMYLIDVYNQKNMPNSAEYFKNIFSEVSEFTKYLNQL